MDDDPSIAARMSYAIRHGTSEDSWLHIDSTNLDTLAASKLPNLNTQRLNFLRWMADQLQNDAWATVRPVAIHLAGVVGTLDGPRVTELIQQLLNERFIEASPEEGGFRLTSAGWDKVEAAERATADAAGGNDPTETDGEASVERADCPVCGPRKRMKVLFCDTVRDPEDGLVFESTTMKVLKCGGCLSMIAKREVIFSQDEEQEQDNETGEWRIVLRPKVSYWPAASRRARPEWVSEVDDEVIYRLMDETYAAVNDENRTLAAMGVRAMLDHVFVLAGGDPGAGFFENLDWLEEEGVIGKTERDILEVMTDAGSAASHRGWCPDREQLDLILAATEPILHRQTVLSAQSAQLSASVPPRPARVRRRRRPMGGNRGGATR